MLQIKNLFQAIFVLLRVFHRTHCCLIEFDFKFLCSPFRLIDNRSVSQNNEKKKTIYVPAKKNLLGRVTRINNQFKQGANERMAWHKNQQQLHKTHTIDRLNTCNEPNATIKFKSHECDDVVPCVCIYFNECPPPSKSRCANSILRLKLSLKLSPVYSMDVRFSAIH